MKYFSKMSLFVATAAIGLAFGCGKKNAGGGGGNETAKVDENQSESMTSPQGSFAVRSVGDLPSCKDFSYSPLAYVVSEGKFYYCNEGTWTDVQIKNAEGSGEKKQIVLKNNGNILGQYLGQVKLASSTENNDAYQFLTEKGYTVFVRLSDFRVDAAAYIGYEGATCTGVGKAFGFLSTIPTPGSIFRLGAEYFYVQQGARASEQTFTVQAQKSELKLDGVCTAVSPPASATFKVIDARPNDMSVTGFIPPQGGAYSGPLTVEYVKVD